MSLDLNGSTTGTNYVTSYVDDAVAIGIVDSGVKVGAGSSSVNTDGVTQIRISSSQWATGDYLQISTLPTGLVLSGAGITAGATSWTGTPSGDVYIQRATGSTSTNDAMWQTALQQVKFGNSTSGSFTVLQRSINVDTLDSSGAMVSHATTTVNIDNTPFAAFDFATVKEAGGVNNGTPGTSASGNLLTNDSDDATDTKVMASLTRNGVAATFGTPFAGAYGSVTVNADGSYVYVVDNTNPNVQKLAVGETLTDNFSYAMTGNNPNVWAGSQLIITIEGANDVPVITGTSTGTVTEDSAVVSGNLTASGTLSIVDPDNGQSSFTAQTSVAGSNNYGTFTLAANGAWTYTANNAQAAIQGLSAWQTLTDSFTATSVDGTTKVVTVTIRGANDAPVATADTATAIEAGGINNGTAGVNPTGNVRTNDTDVDGGDIKSVSAVAFGAVNGTVGSALSGAYGSLVLNSDGSYTYTVDNNNATVQALRTASNTLTETFSYTMRDAAGATSTNTLTVTIQGANDNIVANNDYFDVVASGTANNGTVTTSTSGNILANDTDVDTGDAKLVTSWSGSGSSPYGTASSFTHGSFNFTVNSTNAAVQALRTYSDTLTANYTFWVKDASEAISAEQAIVTIHGANDAPVSASLGQWFDGTAAAVVDPHQNLAAYSNFTLEFKVNPTQTITLNPQSTTGTAGLTGQHYAIWAQQGQATWGSANDAGIGVSVGTNGISVYQHTANLLSPLLTWTGTVNAETQIAVVFNNKTPTLYVDGVAVQTGLQSTVANLHPSTVVGGGSYGYFNGGVSDYHVWDSALSAAQINANLNKGLTGTEAGLVNSQLSTAVTENAVAGTVVGTAHGSDVDTGDTFTYSLINNAGSRFTINATTGVISVASGAVLDYEANTTHNLTVRATDAGGLYKDQAIKVRVANVVEATVAAPDTVLAVEAGGHLNNVPGINPTGNVLTNDGTDASSGTKTVIIVDSGPDDGFVGQPLAGLYGSIVINADGSYSYTVDNANAAVQALRTSEDTLADTFYYTMRDAAGGTSSSTLTVTIAAKNDAPVAGPATGTVTAGAEYEQPPVQQPGNVLATGNVLGNVADVDAGDTKQVTFVAGADGSFHESAYTAYGSYGTVQFYAGGWYTYTANNGNSAVQALRTTGDTLTDTFQYIVRDAWGDTSTSTLTITIQGNNDAPVASAIVVDTAVEAGGVNNGTPGNNPEGSVLPYVHDVDANDTIAVTGISFGATSAVAGSSLAGAYGSVTIDANGHYAYTVDNLNAAVQALRISSDTLTETFTYTVRDTIGATSSSTLTVTIHGANDVPVVYADTAIAIEAGGENNHTPGLDPSGNVLTDDFDADAGDTKRVTIIDSGPDDGFVGQPLHGSFGTLVLQENGDYTYTVDNVNAAVQALRTSEQTLSDTFYYTMQDTAGASSNSTLTVTIQGANDTPDAQSDAATVAAGAAVNGVAPNVTATGSVLINDIDVDGGDTKTVTGWIAQSLNGGYGDLVLGADGNYTYTLHGNNADVQSLRSSGQSLSESFIYFMQDAAGATSSSTLTVTIQGANDAPVAHANTATAIEAGGVNNQTPGLDPSGNVLTDDFDADPGDTKRVIIIDSGPDDGFVGQPLRGSYGTLLLQENGDYAYTVDNVNAAVQALRTSEQTLSDTFYYTMADEAGAQSNSTLTVTIHGADDAPVAPSGSAMMAEDNFFSISATVEGLADLGNGLVQTVSIDAVPLASQGMLMLNGQPVTRGQVMSVADAQTLLFKPNLFNLEAFGITDVDAGDSVQSVRIDSLPSAQQGTLTLAGQPVSAGQVVAVAALSNLDFEPAQDYNGTATFKYSVSDLAGEFSAPPGSFSINVTPVNDTPGIDPLIALDVHQGAATKLAGLHFTDADSGSAPTTVTLHVAAGTLAAAGTSQVAVTGSGSDTVTLTGTLADINAFVDTGSGVSVTAPVYAAPAITATMQLVDPNDTSENPRVRLVMGTSGGNSFTAQSEAGIEISGSGTSEITIVGLASSVATFVNTDRKVTHSAPANDIKLEIKVDDQGHEGADPGLTGGPTNEEAWRGVTLFAMPQGMALREPITASGSTSHPDTGEGISTETAAGLGVGTSLVIALGGWKTVREGLRNRFFPNPQPEGYVIWEPPTPPTVPTAPVLPTPPVPPVAPPLFNPFTWLVGGGAALFALIAILAGHRASQGTNDTPTIDPLQSLDVYQDHATAITGLHFGDGDAQKYSVQVTLTLPNGSGTLAATAAAGVQVSGSGTAQLILVGAVGDINAFIASSSVTYTTANHATGHVSLQVNINDLGNTGSDPGTSGGPNDEQANLTVELDIQPVNHAPGSADAVIAVKEHQAHTFAIADFPFSETVDSNNQLMGVKITSLPTTGVLTLNNTPLTLNGAAFIFVLAQDIAAGKLVFTPGSSGTAQDSTSFTFEVQDGGGVEHDGADTSAQHTMSLNVQHAPVLSMGASAGFDEAHQTQAFLGASATISDVDVTAVGIATVKLTVAQPHFGDSWAVDMVHFADAYAQLGLSGSAPTVNIVAAGENAYTLSFSSGAVPAAVAKALIESLVLRSDSPNLDEGARQFTVQIVDEHDMASNAVTVDVQVQSIFGELLRATDLAQQAIKDDVAETPPAPGQADEQRATLWQWLDAKAGLAQAVQAALSQADTEGELLKVGQSLSQALTALGVDFGTLAGPLTADKLTELRSASAELLDAGDGTLLMSEATRTGLLTTLKDLSAQYVQAQYTELNEVLKSAQPVGGPGTTTLEIAAGTFSLDWFTQLGVQLQAVQSSDPAATIAQSPHALVQDAQGNLWMSVHTLQHVTGQVQIARVQGLDAGAGYAEKALFLLGMGTVEGAFWAVTPDLVQLLDAAGIAHGSIITVAEGADPLAGSPPADALFQTADGQILMSPQMRDVLAGQLSLAMVSQMASQDPMPSSAGELLQALQAATVANGLYSLSATEAQQLTDAGLSFRVVPSFSDDPRAGEIVQDPSGALTMSAQTRASLLAQLEATVGEADQTAPNPYAVSNVLQTLENLLHAQTVSLNGQSFGKVAVSPDLLALLEHNGIAVDDLDRYTSSQIAGVLAERMQSDHETAYRVGDDSIQLPTAVLQSAIAELAADLQSIGLDTGVAAAADVPVTPIVDTRHATLQAASQPATFASVLDVLQETGSALRMLVANPQATTFAQGTSSAFSAQVYDVGIDFARQVLASAGIQVVDLGLADQLDAAARAALASTTTIAAAHTAGGELVLSQAAANALKASLQSQFFHERADLAHSVLAALWVLDDSATVAVATDATHLTEVQANQTGGTGLIVLNGGLLPQLAALGIDAPTVVANGAQLQSSEVLSLQSQAGTVAIDDANHTIVMSAATLQALRQEVAARMQALDTTSLTLPPSGLSASAAKTEVYDAQDAVAVHQSLQTPADTSGSLVWVAANAGTLAKLRLFYLDEGSYTGTSDAAQALSAARLGTVQHSANGQFVMTAATRDWLDEQLQTIQDTAALPTPFDIGTTPAQMLLLNHLLSQVNSGTIFDEAQPVSLHVDDAFLQQLQSNAGVTVQDAGLLSAITDVPHSSLMTAVGTVAHGASGEIFVSAATLAHWADVLSGQAKVAGDLFGTYTSGTEDSIAAPTQWNAPAPQAQAFDAVAAELTPLLLDAQKTSVHTSGDDATVWHIPTEDAATALSALSAQLGTGFSLVDLGQLDPADAADAEELIADGHFIGHAANGDLLMSQSTYQDAVNALSASLDSARALLCSHAVSELAGARWDGNYLVVTDTSLLQDLARLGIHDGGQIVHTNAPADGQLGITLQSEILLSSATCYGLLAQIGRIEPASAALIGNARALLEALDAAGQYPADGNGIACVNADVGLPLDGSLRSVHSGGAYIDSPLGQQNLWDAAPGTVQAGADGKLYMTQATLQMVRAELAGVASQASHDTTVSSSATRLQIAGGLLNYLYALGDHTAADIAPVIDNTASLPEAHDGWWEALKSWAIETTDQLQQQLDALGIGVTTLSLLSDADVANAIHSGALDQPYTVVVDAQGNHLISEQTRQALMQDVIARVQSTTGIDWHAAYGLAPSSVDAISAALGMPDADTPASDSDLRRSIASDEAVDNEAIRDQALDLMAQLLIKQNATVTGEVAYGNNGTAAALAAFLPKFDSFGLAGKVIALVTGNVTNGQYVEDVNGRAVMTNATSQDVLKTLQTVVDMASVRGADDVLDVLTAHDAYMPLRNNTLVKFNGTAALDNFLTHLPDLDTVQVTTVNGTKVTVVFEDLQATADQYASVMNDAAASKTFMANPKNVTTSDGTQVSVLQSELLDAYATLSTDAHAVVPTRDHGWTMSYSAVDWVAAQAATLKSANQLGLVQGVQGALNAAPPAVDGVVHVVISGLAEQLEALGLRTFAAHNQTQLALPGALWDLGDGTVQMTVGTHATLQSQLSSLLDFNAAAASRAFGAVAVGAIVRDDVDYLAETAQVDLISHFANAADPNQPAKLLVSVLLQPDELTYLKSKHLITESFDIDLGNLGSVAQSSFDELYATGKMAQAVDAQGRKVLVMSTETWGEVQSGLLSAESLVQSTLVAVDEASFLGDLRAAHVDFHAITSLPVNGTAVSSFTNSTILANALDEQPRGTVFDDGHGRYWMSVDTSNYLSAQLAPARHATVGPVSSLTGGTVSDQLAAFDALEALFVPGALQPSAPANGTAGAWKGYQINSTLLEELDTLGIPMTALESSNPALLDAAPPLSYVSMPDNTVWISERTFSNLDLQVSLKGSALETALLSGNQWEHVQTTDANGAPRSYWQSVNPSTAELFKLAAGRTAFTMTDLSSSAGNDPVAALAASDAPQSGGFVVDPNGHILISESVHAQLEPALARQSAANRTDFLVAAQAMLGVASTETVNPLVTIHDPFLIDRILAHSNVSLAQAPVNLANLSAANHTFFDRSGIATVAKDTNGDLVMSAATRNWLSNLTSDSVAGLSTDVGMAVPSAPDIVQVRSPQLLPYLSSLFPQIHLAQLRDANGDPIPQDVLDVAALSDAQRRELANHPDMIVLDKAGNLLMSTSTWQALELQLDQQSASQAHSLTQQLAHDAALATSIQVPASGGSTVTLHVLPGDGASWLHELKTAGLAYKIVDIGMLAATTPTDGTVSDATSGGVRMALNAQGSIVMDDESFSTLQAWIAEFDAVYSGVENSPRIPDSIPLPVASDSPDSRQIGESFIAEAGGYADAAKSVRSAYGVLTVVRYWANRNMYTDNSVLRKQHGDAIKDTISAIFDVDNPQYQTNDALRAALQKIGYGQQTALDIDALFTARSDSVQLGDDAYNYAASVGPAIERIARSLTAENVVASRATFEREVRTYLNKMSELAASSDDSSVDDVDTQVAGFLTRYDQMSDVGVTALKNELNSNDVGSIKQRLWALSRNARGKIEADTTDKKQDILDYGDELVADKKDEYAQSNLKRQLDAFNTAQNAVQFSRFLISMTTLVTSMPAKFVDATIHLRQAASVLGDTPEADKLRLDYRLEAALSFGEGTRYFFSGLEIPSAYFTNLRKVGWEESTIRAAGQAFLTRTKTDWHLIFSSGTIKDAPNIFNQIFDKSMELAKAKGKNSIWKYDTWIPNVDYGITDIVWGIDVLLQLGIHAYQNTPASRYYAAQDVATLAQVGLTIYGDIGGWLHYGTVGHNAAWALGHSIYYYAVYPQIDSIALAAIQGIYGEESGTNWAQVADAFALGLANSILLTAGIAFAPASLLSMLLVPRPSLWMQASEYAALYEEYVAMGRTVEAEAMFELSNREWWKSAMVAQILSWTIGAYDLVGANWQQSDYEQAVRERQASLETHPEEGHATPSQDLLAHAKSLGWEGNFYNIAGGLVDFNFTINSGIRVMKFVEVHHFVGGQLDVGAPRVSFYDEGVDISGTVNNLHNHHTIRVDVSNRTGSVAYYWIDPEATMTLNIGEVTGPYVEVDAGNSTANSVNVFVVQNPHALIRGGASTDIYLLTGELQTVHNDSTVVDEMVKEAGFIVDGQQSAGRDLVSFELAPGGGIDGQMGYNIHAGVGYAGFTFYDGITSFKGSAFNDLFTRYGGNAGSRTWVNYRGGGGRDVFDLRSGNNDVTLMNGEVHFEKSGTQGIAVDPSNGPYLFAATNFDALFNNNFTTNNQNIVNLQQGAAYTDLVEVHGNAFAQDGVGVTLWSQAVQMSNALAGLSQESHTFLNEYGIRTLDGKNLIGWFDANVDEFAGTQFADSIKIEQQASGTALKRIFGGGGDDTIEIDAPNIVVVEKAGNALITLGEHALGANVVAGAGNTVTVNTQASSAPTSDEAVTVSVSGLTGERKTIVDASLATDALVVSAGSAADLTVNVGLGDTKIIINATTSDITINDNALRQYTGSTVGHISLQFLDATTPFDVTQLVDGSGSNAHPLTFTQLDGSRVMYETTWMASGNHAVHLTYVGDPTHLDAVNFGAYNPQSSNMHAFQDLVATAQPHIG